MVREIVTLQLGELSNYVATHFWNTQESYFTYGDETPPVDHNVHWRQGLGAGGDETFLPRTLVYDFRGNFGALSRSNPLYDDGGEPATDAWHGEPSVRKEAPIPKSAYHEALDTGAEATVSKSTVRYWSDFSRTYLHPRSIVQISDLESSPSSDPTRTLDTFEQGRDLFSSLDAEEDVLDQQLRPFVEECDLLQGLQVIGGGDDGWGGFGSAMLDRVRDEFGKTCVWYWMPEGISAGGRGKQLSRLLNKAKALSEVYTQVDTAVPLSVPPSTHPSYTLDPTSKWHLSALLSTALESATLPTRLRGGSPPSLSDLSTALNVQGHHTISRLRMGLGAGRGAEGAVDHALDVDLFDLTGEARGRKKENSSSSYGQVLSQRGEQSDLVYESLFGDPPHPTTTRYTTSLAYPLPESFPNIYPSHQNLSVDTLLSTDPHISTSATALRKHVLPFLRGDERESVGNALAEIGEEYHDGWDSEESEDD